MPFETTSATFLIHTTSATFRYAACCLTTARMKPFDPEFSEISNEQLAQIDIYCNEYEAKRTKGLNVSIESFLNEANKEIHTPLRHELIQIEMEILDAWDQLNSLDTMLQQFPEQEKVVRAQWSALKSRKNTSATTQTTTQSSRDTLGNAPSTQTSPSASHQSTPSNENEDANTNFDDLSPRFRIVRNLAQGGIGTVFVAFDRDLQREVAIKELKRKFANVSAIVQRFEAEASVTGNLEHPNIVPIYATGRRSDGRPYYAMRLIHGRSMQMVIADMHRIHGPEIDFRKNPLARDLILRFITVCRAVGFAHSRGVLHRDLKPSNIMVGSFGETLVVDWGLARQLNAPSPNNIPSSVTDVENSLDPQRTSYGTIVGTPGYMSPEQAIGRSEEISVASDIYSLGATLFHILTNTVPHRHTGAQSSDDNHSKASNVPSKTRDDTEVCVLNATMHGDLDSLDRLIATPKPLVAICQQALKQNPADRYASAERMANDLEAWFLDEPVSVLPETRIQKMRRWAKSHPAIVASGIASLLISLIAMGITLSILSAKNESLRISNDREHKSAQEASQNAAIAKKNGEEAIHQRQRVLEILKTFLVDVERGLANVPGSGAVQRNVLTTVLNKLGEVSSDFSDDQLNQSNAMALVDLGDLFSRVGTKDIKLDVPRWNQMSLSPLEAAYEMYSEAMKIVLISEPNEGTSTRRLIAIIQQKQAAVLRQTSRTQQALKLLEESLATCRILLEESPGNVEAALDVVAAIDLRGQIYLQDGNFSEAFNAFSESRLILEQLTSEDPNSSDIRRRLGIAYSRIADIAKHNGDLDSAADLYDKDLAIATALYVENPNNLLTKSDLCTSLDRIGNMSAERGQLEKALEAYLESRRLREELHSAEPTNRKTNQELFVSYMKSGDTRMLMKEVDTAQLDYAKALALADELAQADPQNVTARRYQSLSAEVLADVAIARSQFDDALVYANKSLAISLELLAKEPTNGQMQRDLYICYVKVSKVLLGKKDFDECQKQLDLALKVTQQLYEKQPDSMQAFGDYSFVLLKRAEAFLEAGNAATASIELESVLQMLESVPESNRQDSKSRRRIANTVTMLGRAHIANGEIEKARIALERSRQLTIAMINENMRVDQMRIDLTDIEALIQSLDDKE